MAKRKGKTSKKPKRARANGAAEAASENGEGMPVGGNFKRAVKEYVGRIINLHGDLDSERSTYMNACKPIHSDIKELYGEAKGEGIPTRELKAAVKMRLLDLRKERVRDALDENQQSNLDNIRMALGDLETTPLGQAAVAREEAGAEAH